MQIGTRSHDNVWALGVSSLQLRIEDGSGDCSRQLRLTLKPMVMGAVDSGRSHSVFAARERR